MLFPLHEFQDLLEDFEVSLFLRLERVSVEERNNLLELVQLSDSKFFPGGMVYDNLACPEELLQVSEHCFIAFMLNYSELW